MEAEVRDYIVMLIAGAGVRVIVREFRWLLEISWLDNSMQGRSAASPR